MLLAALLFSLLPNGVRAFGEPTTSATSKTVEFYYGKPRKVGYPSAVDGFITHDQLKIYDSDGVEQQWSVEPNKYVGGTLDAEERVVKYDLTPGVYSWVGKMSNGDPASSSTVTNIAGEGYFEVEEDAEDAQKFFLARGRVRVVNADIMGIGLDIELIDYLGNTVKPYKSTYYNAETSGEFGVTSCEYLVLMQRKPTSAESDEADADLNDEEPVEVEDFEKSYQYIAKPRNPEYPIREGLLYFRDVDFDKLGTPSSPLFGTSLGEADPEEGGILIYKEEGVTLNISVTKGAELHLYDKNGYHYRPFIEIQPFGKVSASGYDKYSYSVTPMRTVHYEAGGGKYLKEAQGVSGIKPSITTKNIYVDLEKRDNHFEDGYTHVDSDVLLNTDDSRSINLDEGETFDLFPIRIWQAMLGVVGNYFTEPDYQFEVIDAETGDSQTLKSLSGGKIEEGSISLEKIGQRGHENYRITGLERGISLLKIKYDAILWRGGIIQDVIDDNTHRNTEYERNYFNATEARETPVIVISVGGADNSAIDFNIATPGERGADGEDDTIYFADSESGVDFTFSPTSTTAGDVSVRVHEPIYSISWKGMKNGWSDLGKKPSGSEFTVNLKDGHNIVEVRSGDAVKYHVIHAKAVPISVTNKMNPDWKYGDVVSIGDEINLHFTGLKTPIQKLSGIYNPRSVYVEYSSNSSDAFYTSRPVQYSIREGVDITLPITQSGETAIFNGRIYNNHYGSPYGSHRTITIAGYRPNLDADLPINTPYHSMLPDFTFSTAADNDKEDDDENKDDDDKKDDVVAKVMQVSSPKSVVYKAKAQRPTVSVKDKAKVLKAGTDYTVKYKDNVNVGTASVTVTGKGAYADSLPVTKTFKVTPASASSLKVKVASGTYQYTGKKVKPGVKVTLGGVKLRKGVDYTVSFGANKKIGKGSVKVTARKPNFKAGSKSVAFQVVPKKTSVSKVAVGKRLAKVSWKEISRAQKATKYQVRYRVKGSSKWLVKSLPGSWSKALVRNLKSGKAYQFQVRSYKTVAKAKYYSPWSAARTSGRVG
jgi:hypothetical protein